MQQQPQVSDQDVIIIGAGPSGTVAASLLRKRGHSVTIVERQQFPRFSIGESLLPQCMGYLEEAELLPAVQKAKFQLKNGARFEYGERSAGFHFDEKYTEGWGTTFEVQRDRFDKLLADEAEKKAVTINYGEEVKSIRILDDGVEVQSSTESGHDKTYAGRFLLDASGFGRVLPRLLDLEEPSDFPVRQSIFTHIDDRITNQKFDREKILITIHPEHRDVWFWLIPFSNGRSSLGVVAKEGYFAQRDGDDEAVLKQLVQETHGMKRYLADSVFDRPVQKITGYSANVKSLWGKNFALLGNAGEFLDPVFSSGVTIAMKSASLAAAAIDRSFKGKAVDWDTEYAQPLMVGVDTFRTFVEAWYDQRLQDIIFYPSPVDKFKRMICSILAGYAWDETNPFVKESRRRVDLLAEICRS